MRLGFGIGRSSLIGCRIERLQAIQDMGSEDEAMVIKFLDLAIRDAKAKKAYA